MLKQFFCFVILVHGVILETRGQDTVLNSHKWQIGIQNHALLTWGSHFGVFTKAHIVFNYHKNAAINAGIVTHPIRFLYRKRGRDLSIGVYVGHQFTFLSTKKRDIKVFVNTQFCYGQGDFVYDIDYAKTSNSSNDDGAFSYVASAVFGVFEIAVEKKWENSWYVQLAPNTGIKSVYGHKVWKNYFLTGASITVGKYF